MSQLFRVKIALPLPVLVAVVVVVVVVGVVVLQFTDSRNDEQREIIWSMLS